MFDDDETTSRKRAAELIQIYSSSGCIFNKKFDSLINIFRYPKHKSTSIARFVMKAIT